MHILSQIDLEHKTALCSVCGHTAIHVPKNYDQRKSKIVCAQRYKEQNLTKKMWSALSPDERKLIRKERHRLAEIDPELRRATCIICGPTDIYRYAERGRTVYRCATYIRLSNRSGEFRDFLPPVCESVSLAEIYQKKKAAKGLLSWTELNQVNSGDWPRPNRPKSRLGTLKHASEKKRKRFEENTHLVHEYKRTHPCKRCGIRGLVLRKIRFFELPFPYDQKIR